MTSHHLSGSALAFGGALEAVSLGFDAAAIILPQLDKHSQHSPKASSIRSRATPSHSPAKRLQHRHEQRPGEKDDLPKERLRSHSKNTTPTMEVQEEARSHARSSSGIGLVHVLGSFLLGLLIAAPMIDRSPGLVVQGFLAGFTTFSWSWIRGPYGVRADQARLRPNRGVGGVPSSI